MALNSEGLNIGDVVAYENPVQKYSRDQVTLITGQNLAIGAVVGIITASGKVTALAPAASDGSQTAAGVLGADTNATSADVNTFMIARQAVVKAGALVWPGGITAPQKAAAIAQLKALGVIVRNQQ